MPGLMEGCMKEHYLSPKEIDRIPAGRVLDTLVEEYVIGNQPRIWLAGAQRFEQAGWFDRRPRMIAEDEGDAVCESVPRYSTDEREAVEVQKRLMQEGCGVAVSQTEDGRFLAGILGSQGQTLCNSFGQSVAEAVCRAALKLGSVYRR